VSLKGRRRAAGDTLVESPVAGVPTVFAMGQGGLLDVAVHPDLQSLYR
jgi:glucose/arabinose dehydrogenase